MNATIFTGGIGENGQFIRADLWVNLSFLGVEIDPEVNAKALHGVEAEISTPASRVRVFVIPTEEERMIARDTKAIVEAM